MGKQKTICNGLNCNVEIEVNICCNAFDCGCQGLPTEPPFCSEKCFDEWMKNNNQPKVAIP